MCVAAKHRLVPGVSGGAPYARDDKLCEAVYPETLVQSVATEYVSPLVASVIVTVGVSLSLSVCRPVSSSLSVCRPVSSSLSVCRPVSSSLLVCHRHCRCVGQCHHHCLCVSQCHHHCLCVSQCHHHCLCVGKCHRHCLCVGEDRSLSLIRSLLVTGLRCGATCYHCHNWQENKSNGPRLAKQEAEMILVFHCKN